VPRSWERGDRATRRDDLLRKYPELGFFDDAGFDPANWHPVLDNPAFVRQTARDRYWGAKRIVAFSETEIRAAAALGHYAAQTEERLVEILLRRRERIARAFLSEVAPLDYFRLEGGRLCFEDLWIRAGLDGARASTARCIDVTVERGDHVVELFARGHIVRVHFVADGRAAHVIGIER
jgi:hypothetical protein